MTAHRQDRSIGAWHGAIPRTASSSAFASAPGAVRCMIRWNTSKRVKLAAHCSAPSMIDDCPIASAAARSTSPSHDNLVDLNVHAFAFILTMCSVTATCRCNCIYSGGDGDAVTARNSPLGRLPGRQAGDATAWSTVRRGVRGQRRWTGAEGMEGEVPPGSRQERRALLRIG